MAHQPPPWQMPPTRLPTLVQTDPAQHLPLPLPLPPLPSAAGGARAATASAAPESAAALLPPLSSDERAALRALAEDAQTVQGVLEALRAVDLGYLCVACFGSISAALPPPRARRRTNARPLLCLCAHSPSINQQRQIKQPTARRGRRGPPADPPARRGTRQQPPPAVAAGRRAARRRPRL
jgi:hypothetical protein